MGRPTDFRENKTMAGGSITQDHLKTFKDSLPRVESIRKFISEKKKDTISHVSGLVSYAWKKSSESSLPRKIEAFLVPRDNASVPSVEKIMTTREIPESSQPRKIKVDEEERRNKSVPSVKKMTSTWELAKSPLPRKIESVRGNTSVISVKNDTDYLVEIIKQHPYLLGIIVLLVLWKYYRYPTSSAGGGRRMTMKAYGRDRKIPENDIERFPEPYGLELRRKKGKLID